MKSIFLYVQKYNSIFNMIFKTFLLTIISASSLCQGKYNSWTAYGGDAGGTRYSALTEINESNVHLLKPAWTFRTGELDTYKGTTAIEKAAFEATPILVDNLLYFSTPSSRIFAIDPATGKQRWIFDAQVNLKKHYSEIASRGVSAWPTIKNSANKKI